MYLEDTLLARGLASVRYDVYTGHWGVILSTVGESGLLFASVDLHEALHNEVHKVLSSFM